MADGPNRVLGIYKKLLRLAQRLPATERGGAVARVRASFREGKGEQSPERFV